jgi:hypothetical protein
MAIVRRRKLLLPGPVLIGFSEFFDRAWGDPLTERPYPKVTPSCVGGVLLPFACPHCGVVKSAVIDPKTRLGYWDQDRDFSWCPACQKRYVIESKGTPLKSALPAGATHAPALVERVGKTEVVGLLEDGLHVLGAF